MNKKEELILNKHTSIMSKEYEMPEDIAKVFIEKAIISKEIGCFDDEAIESWYDNVFKQNSFFIDDRTYLEASIQALKIQFLIAGTDFGTSRQRDLGQKWADTIRGYLGEFGVKQLLENKWKKIISLGHKEGTLEEYLNTDIHAIKDENQKEFRHLNKTVSIKTIKANGIWLDIPGDQFRHSDYYISAKIGVGIDHLFSFFKQISVFKDKILKCGKDKGCISEDEAQDLYDRIPNFQKIFGYLPGFIERDNYINGEYEYEGKKGKKTTRYIILQANMKWGI